MSERTWSGSTSCSANTVLTAWTFASIVEYITPSIRARRLCVTTETDAPEDVDTWYVRRGGGPER